MTGNFDKDIVVSVSNSYKRLLHLIVITYFISSYPRKALPFEEMHNNDKPLREEGATSHQ